MADIFVSYASQDRERVRHLVESLTIQGWSVWWDRDIALGSGFAQTIEREISRAQCVLAVWSEHSVDSRWVNSEALDALDRDRLRTRG